MIVEVSDPLNKVYKVEFCLTSPNLHGYVIEKTLYNPPYEWKWNEKAYGFYGILCAAYYGNAGAVVADKIEVYIINPFPSPSKSSLAKTNSFTIKGWVPQNK